MAGNGVNGSAGNDTFKFCGLARHHHRLHRYAGGGNKDLIDISGLGITAATFAANVKIGGGGNALITVGAGNANTIPLSGKPELINITDFKLA